MYLSSHLRRLAGISLLLCMLAHTSLAQDKDAYIDPHDFSDVSREASDEAFFHLERFFQLSLLAGVGKFTGGLGATHGFGGMFGFSFIYFFDQSFAYEQTFWYAFQDNYVEGFDYSFQDPNTAQPLTESSTTHLFTAAPVLRYYVGATGRSSRFINNFSPYVLLGLEWISRRQTVYQSSEEGRSGTSISDSNLGIVIGGGLNRLIYSDSLYAIFDVRFHYLAALGGRLDDTEGFSKDGHYLTFHTGINYNF